MHFCKKWSLHSDPQLIVNDTVVIIVYQTKYLRHILPNAKMTKTLYFKGPIKAELGQRLHGTLIRLKPDYSCTIHCSTDNPT